MSKDVFADYPEIRPEPIFEDEFVLGDLFYTEAEWAAEAIPAPADVPPGLTESEERALWGDR